MILSMGGQGWLFLSTVGAGAGIGVLYDVLRVLRKTFPHGTFLVQIEDLLFWLAATGGVFYFMLLRNSGEIRIFSVIGVVLGSILYFATVSKFIMKVCLAIVEYLKKVIATAIRIVLLPFTLLGGWLLPPIERFLRKRHKSLRGLARYGKMKARKTSRDWFILRKKV